MPTIPLYTPPADANTWHQVRAPGGFELWQFVATAGDINVTIDFCDGDPFDQAYRNAYRKYLNAPTRTAPPIPSIFPHVMLSVYQRGKRTCRFQSRDPFVGLVEQVGGRVGEHSFARNEKTEIVVHVGQPRTASADLRFLYAWPQSVVIPLLPNLSWIPMSPACDVIGQIHVEGRTIPLAGYGSCNHYVGLAPLEAAAKHWFRGVQFGKTLHVFHELTLAKSQRLASFRVWRVDADKLKELNVNGLGMTLRPELPWRMTYPLAVDVPGCLKLESPRLLESSSRQVRMLYGSFGDEESGITFSQSNSF